MNVDHLQLHVGFRSLFRVTATRSASMATLSKKEKEDAKKIQAEENKQCRQTLKHIEAEDVVYLRLVFLLIALLTSSGTSVRTLQPETCISENP